MSIKKTLYLIIMTIILCIMTLGYAALQERIDIEVEASIDSTYRVEITSVQEGTVVGDARSVSAPSYNNLTSTFNVGLTNNTDYITYTIEITNYSTVDIRLNNTEITSTNDNISATKSGIRNGDIMLAGSTKTVTIKIKLDTETGSEQNGTVTVMFDFTRLKGGLGEVQEDNYYFLPNGYQELEYIESTGTQYIDTGLYANEYPNLIVEMEGNYTINNGSQYIFGAGDNGNAKSYILLGQTSSLGFIGQIGIAWTEKSIMTADTQKHKFILDALSNVATIDSTSVNMDANNIRLINYKYFLFALDISNSIYNRSWFRMNYCKIMNNDIIIRDYIPVLDNNNVPCLYDTVTGNTFYNQGTGDFLYKLKE